MLHCHENGTVESGAGVGAAASLVRDLAAASEVPGEHVVALDILQSKSRWLDQERGYVAAGYRTKRKLLKVFDDDQVRAWSHVTLTYDPWCWVPGGRPAGFESLSQEDKEAIYAGDAFQEACKRCYQAAKSKRHVGEFVRRLRKIIGRFAYFYVIEFQGNGSTHFHLLIDRPFVLHSDLMRTWGHGFVLIKAAVRDTFSYLAKYLMKGICPPGWLLPMSSRLRMAGASRGLFGTAADRPDRRQETDGRGRAVPTIGQVRANPRRHLKTMMRIILATGEMIHRHVNVDISTCVDMLGQLGVLGGFEMGRAKLDGIASMMVPPGVRLSLDQLAYCGTGGGAQGRGSEP